MFGPNISKMKEKGDTQGLTKELKNNNPEIRSEAVKALAELKNVAGLAEALSADDPITRRAGFHGLARGGMRTRPKGVKQSLSSRSATGLPVGIYGRLLPFCIHAQLDTLRFNAVLSEVIS